MSEVQRDTITVPEAGKRLGISRQTAYEAVKKGDIPVIKISGRLLVPKVQFDRLPFG